ncbi:hypothetical protein [Candidatus Cyanaurora vandensis]|uniref:hypothetical protein n=1 Tax=Candidatus Cyanaurora vandensis TaxID=2714958 RepID=UPI002579BA79|nr:hypothetical protein [Candidatus Cyanaurora vandensis]
MLGLPAGGFVYKFQRSALLAVLMVGAALPLRAAPVDRGESGNAMKGQVTNPLKLPRERQDWVGIKLLGILKRKPEMAAAAAEIVTRAESDSGILGAVSSGAPVLSTNFDSVRGSGLEPPDPDMAVGPSDLIASTNYGLQIHSKTGAPIGGILGLKSFFAVPNSYNIISDPKFIYDSESGRYFGVLIGYSNSTRKGAWFLVTSTTNSASGTWNTFRVEIASKLPDYPGFGVCSDKLLLSANNFGVKLGIPFNFTGTVAVALNKSQLVGGNPSVAYTIFGNSGGGLKDSAGAQIFTLQPARGLSANTTCHLVSVNGTTNAKAQLYRVTGVPGVGGGAVLTTGLNLPIAPISSPVKVPQLGSSIKLDSGDNRILDSVYRNGVLWGSFNSGCTFAGDTTKYDCARVFKIGDVDGTASVQFDGSYGAAGFYYTYPALSIDAAGNMTTVFTASNSTIYSSVRFGGLAAGATALEPSALLVSSGAPYTGTRWGDYLGADFDSTDGSIWVIGEYKPAGTGFWGTYVGKTQF